MRFNFFGSKPNRERTLDVDPFTDILLDLQIASVEVHPGSNYQVIITDYEDYPISAEVHKQKLVVTEQNQRGFGFNAGIIKLKIEIIVPQDATLSKITGTNVNGSLKLVDLTCGQVDLKGKNGSSKLANVHITQALNLEAANGSITLDHAMLTQFNTRLQNGSLNITDCQMTIRATLQNGSVHLDGNKFLGQNIIDLTNGSVKLQETSNNVSYHISTVVGLIIYHGSKVGKHFATDNDDNNTLALRTVNGNIKIN